MIARKTPIVLFLSLSTLIACFAVTAIAQVDTTFRASVYHDLINTTGDVRIIKFQPDGKYLIGGIFTEVGGVGGTSLARINQDGTTDSTFSGPDFYNGTGQQSTIHAIAIQPDGKILVGGDISGSVTPAGNDPRPGIRRLNPDGSIDPTFFVQNVGQFSAVYEIKIQADGKILIGGIFAIPNSNLNLARLNADGTNDTSFSAPNSPATVRDIEILSDGKIIAAGYNTSGGIAPIIRKFNTDGSLDGTFTHTNGGTSDIQELVVLGDGKMLVCGNFSALGSTQVGRIARLNADGTVDSSFNPGGEGAVGSVNDIAVRPDGKIIIVGGISSYNGNTIHRIARLNTDGTFDNTFTNNGVMTNSATTDVELLPDNSMIVGTINSVLYNSLVHISADGVFDTSYIVHVTRAGVVREVLQQSDGKVLAAGMFLYANGTVRRSLARFNTDGTLDTSFVPYFNNVAPLPVINAIALQADGKILVGSSNGFVLTRLNTDGSQDGTFTAPFPTTSHVWDILVQADGKILVGGDMTISTLPYRFTRLNSNGTRDAGFNPPQPGNRVHKVFVQSDGKFLVGGIFATISDIANRHLIARFNADGSLDGGFIPPGTPPGQVSDIDVQPDGKILRAGVGLLRLNTNGTNDDTFSATMNAEVSAVKVLPGGKILVGGGFSLFNGTAKNGIALLNSNGSLDLGFDAFANRAVNSMYVQTDGKVLLGGTFTKINAVPNVRVARISITSTPRPALFDYDGDGKADISVFRPSENRWYVLRSSDSVVSQTVWAIAGDVPVPADYDGDLKTDIAIYRPSSGAWWYLSSQNGAQINANWGGEAGDIPRPSDFNGDGKTDFIIFRPTNSTWYRITSTGTVSNVAFGLSGDKPVIGDFDGDGKSDVAIFRPSTGDWWYQSSINNAQLAVRWGISTDTPAPADFDGDGKTDFAVFRPSTGVWYVINSSNGSFLIGPFGISEDKPVPADYDGDGKAELAVFRPSTGIWYQLRTNGGFFALQFGVSTDTPTPSAFVP